MNRYVHIFDYRKDDGWMIICYENNRQYKYFNEAEYFWYDALDYVEEFLKNGGNEYYYEFSNYSIISDLDVFSLKNEIVEELQKYLIEN